MFINKPIHILEYAHKIWVRIKFCSDKHEADTKLYGRYLSRFQRFLALHLEQCLLNDHPKLKWSSCTGTKNRSVKKQPPANVYFPRYPSMNWIFLRISLNLILWIRKVRFQVNRAREHYDKKLIDQWYCVIPPEVTLEQQMYTTCRQPQMTRQQKMQSNKKYAYQAPFHNKFEWRTTGTGLQDWTPPLLGEP